ncbi:uncharacterized protein K444DRAFT_78670 [Hyaloscypha bicolor E]|uniref:Uncharacterized protein n=1 Tax=Hyaloscypha bicolor E TaxID=1095630 RepID=A0A2J6SYA0_9HELO|nr:uncharacterized protein K444DRAFT_78670 [Hyaloscypha bicolor E]PMD55745.1 hypothetical protein K444DRAFT_78670 [Hyaloscypha bicolor E]
MLPSAQCPQPSRRSPLQHLPSALTWACRSQTHYYCLPLPLQGPSHTRFLLPPSLPLLSPVVCLVPSSSPSRPLETSLGSANHLSPSPNFILRASHHHSLHHDLQPQHSHPVLSHPTPIAPFTPITPPPCRHDIIRSSLSQINNNPRCATSSSGITSHHHTARIPRPLRSPLPFPPGLPLVRPLQQRAARLSQLS